MLETRWTGIKWRIRFKEQKELDITHVLFRTVIILGICLLSGNYQTGICTWFGSLLNIEYGHFNKTVSKNTVALLRWWSREFGWFLSDEKLILETPAFKLCPGGQLELSIQISYKIFRSLLFDGCWDTDMAALTSH